MSSLKILLGRKKYFAPAFLFSCSSLIFSTWVTYIPYIADKIGITEGKIGGAIFFTIIGALCVIPICKRLINRLGVGRYAYFSVIVYALTLFAPFLAYNYASLCVALFFFGMAGSALTITMNALIATIEQRDHIFIMSASHGFWSLGGAVGATSGSFIAAHLHNPLSHIALIAIALVIIQTYLKPTYYNIVSKSAPHQKQHRGIIKPLINIALIGIIFMVSEGAIADWSALYLKKIILVHLQYIGLGYAAFSFAMTIGRFTGDGLSKKLGSWKLISFASLISVIGFLLVLVIEPIIAIVGFFVVGLGFSVIVPEVYRVASNEKSVKTADSVAFIAATSNIGFLAGPVLLGVLAEIQSLHVSYMLVTLCICLALIMSIYINYKNNK
jgi:MFS family permease